MGNGRKNTARRSDANAIADRVSATLARVPRFNAEGRADPKADPTTIEGGRALVDLVLFVVGEHLAKQGSCYLPGFGTFEVRRYARRVMPTGVVAPAGERLTWRASKVLVERVTGRKPT